MSLDERIGKLREGIEGMPTISDMVAALQEGNQNRADEIIRIEATLISDFNGVFQDFKSDKKNAEKLSEYAQVLFDIRPKLGIEVAEKVVFLIYVNNNVDGVNMAFVDAGSINFGQYISEYVEWEKFREHFGNSNIPDEFFETEGDDVKVYKEKRQEHLKAIFLAMKDKFQFTPENEDNIEGKVKLIQKHLQEPDDFIKTAKKFLIHLSNSGTYQELNNGWGRYVRSLNFLQFMSSAVSTNIEELIGKKAQEYADTKYGEGEVEVNVFFIQGHKMRSMAMGITHENVTADDFEYQDKILESIFYALKEVF